jgi:argininosuccinate synthase
VTKKKPYSIDRNLWGISIEAGVLENLEQEPPEDAYLITKSPSGASTYPKYIEIYFEKGVPKKIDGRAYKLKNLIHHLNEVGGLYGVGRTDLVENRLVGIKSREIYEAPAATILHITHKELESLALDRELAHFKEAVSLKYAELVYYGLWYSPLKEALDSFVDSTQKRVTGSIKVKLFKGSCIAVGRKSPHSLYKKELATYGREDKFDQKLAEGFIKIWGMPYRKNVS